MRVRVLNDVYTTLALGATILIAWLFFVVVVFNPSAVAVIKEMLEVIR